MGGLRCGTYHHQPGAYPSNRKTMLYESPGKAVPRTSHSAPKKPYINTAIPCVWPTRLAMVVGGTTSEDRRCVGWTKSCGVVGATYIMLQE